MAGESEKKVNHDFGDDIALRALLWCNRHCCVCGKQCGVGIELAHIDPVEGGTQDNCLPACFDCHMMIGHYNDKHPRGRKFKAKELKERREQVYEQQTRSLVPPLQFMVDEYPNGLPDVSFKVFHRGTYPPVQVRIAIKTLVDGQEKGTVLDSPHYDGTRCVNLNPGSGFEGHFRIPVDASDSSRRISVHLFVQVIDPYQREHPLLPFGYVRDPGTPKWYYEPAPDAMTQYWATQAATEQIANRGQSKRGADSNK